MWIPQFLRGVFPNWMIWLSHLTDCGLLWSSCGIQVSFRPPSGFRQILLLFCFGKPLSGAHLHKNWGTAIWACISWKPGPIKGHYSCHFFFLVPSWMALKCILAEGAIALLVTLSGSALFASWKLLQFPSRLIVKVIRAIFKRASAQSDNTCKGNKGNTFIPGFRV